MNDSWEDGPCRSCYCDMTSTRGICNKIECSAPLISSDYVIVPHTKYGQCCPSYKKESCIFNGTVYNVGSEWSAFDPCVSMSCKLDNNGEAFITESIKSCNTECPLVNNIFTAISKINCNVIYFNFIRCNIIDYSTISFRGGLIHLRQTVVAERAYKNIV